MLNLLLSERFVDASPRQVYAQLLQEGVYHCSYRTMYRLLHQHQAVCERRKLRRHPAYSKPELKATGPNQVWTWDITYLKTPVRGHFHYLYVVIDIYSRYVVGWMLASGSVRSWRTHCCKKPVVNTTFFRTNSRSMRIAADR